MALERALERVVVAALAATVFAFACGSSVVGRILLYGRPARWVCLFALLAVALAYAASTRTRRTGSAFVSAAIALAVLGLVSTLWSVDPHLTVRRAATMAALVATGAALFHGTRGRPDAIRRLLLGLLTGSVLVALAGLVVLLVVHADAIQPATYEYPARFRGLGQNPNTMSLLHALGIPIAVYLALNVSARGARAVATAAALLLAGSIAVAGSRGALLGALAGSLVLVFLSGGGRRRRAGLAALVVATFAVCVAISQIPQAKSPPSKAIARAAAPTRRTLFSSSGRTAAWRGAIHQAEQRPLLGYGFGTEELAFVNRYRGFASELPENSYIGAGLQLGVAGVAVLLAAVALVLGSLALRLRGLDPAARGAAAACAGVAVAALVAAVTQSYLFSVGNVGTVTAWLSLFLLSSVVNLRARARDG